MIDELDCWVEFFAFAFCSGLNKVGFYDQCRHPARTTDRQAAVVRADVAGCADRPSSYRLPELLTLFSWRRATAHHAATDRVNHTHAEPISSIDFDWMQAGRRTGRQSSPNFWAFSSSDRSSQHPRQASINTQRHARTHPTDPPHRHHTPTHTVRSQAQQAMATPATVAFKAEGHSCFVIGWTGEVGKELVKVRVWMNGCQVCMCCQSFDQSTPHRQLNNESTI